MPRECLTRREAPRYRHPRTTRRFHGQSLPHYTSQQQGKKLYAVRDSEGRFKDIQTYERAHRMDLQRTSAETAQGKKEGREEDGEEKTPEDRQETIDAAVKASERSVPEVVSSSPPLMWSIASRASGQSPSWPGSRREWLPSPPTDPPSAFTEA
jgi:hypothetical protein